MLGDEIIHENTYQEFFGGGFELIAYNDGQLKIVSDFAVVPYVINYENFKIKDFNLKEIYNNNDMKKTSYGLVAVPLELKKLIQDIKMKIEQNYTH